MRLALIVAMLAAPAWAAEPVTCDQAIVRVHAMYPVHGAWPPAQLDVSITRDPNPLTRELAAESHVVRGWTQREGIFTASRASTDVTFSRRGDVEIGVAWPTALTPRAREAALGLLETMLASCTVAPSVDK